MNVTSHAMNRRALLTALGAGALLPVAASAQMMASPDSFRIMDLMGGEFAIQTSQIALDRSRARSVREFAQIEIQEQTGVAAALRGVPGTTPLRRDQAAIVRRLAAMPSGPAFDRAYIRGQIIGHRELLALNTNYAAAGFDPIGRSVAVSSLPIIQSHLAFLMAAARA